jgi:hypothetical protein
MKKTVLFLMACAFQISIAQTNQIVENYPLKAMDLVLNSFGMDNPVPVGTITDSGNLNFNFPKNLNSISDEVKTNFISDAAFTLFSKCDGSYNILSEEQNSKAINVGYISLSTKENPYAALLFMVTDENMVPWLEAYGAIDAVMGSYFELVYMESDFNYKGECTSTATYVENDPVETIYTYDLHLKAGFNFIEYKIESAIEHEIPSMYEENVFEKIKKPSTIIVTSSQSTPQNLKWVGKYF